MNTTKVLLLLALCAVAIVPLQASAAGDDGKEILYWVAPMDPNYRRDKPGKSPMGMELIPVYAGADDGGGGVTIAPEVVQNLGVRTAKVERSRLWRGIDTVGYVDYDESKVGHIHLRTEGWIERLSVESEGERVRKGQRLFDLYSPELVNAQEEYVQSRRSGNAGLMRASRDRLQALGISDSQIDALRKTGKVKQTISVYAPQDGVVSTLPVRDGMFVKPSMRVMSLADLSSIWLLVEVFERQANWVAVGQPAEVKLSYLPGQVWAGKVEYIYPDLDPKTRTLKVRLRFDNPGEIMKPNMYANVKIFGGPKNDTIVVPIQALIRTGRDERLIIAKGKGRFEAREVRAGIESGDWVEILGGVKPGEDVVISGQFLIDSEASLKASFTRMSEPDTSSQEVMDEPEAVISAEGTGVIKSIMVDHRMVKLAHGPIESLGWPAMTMDFTVAEDVSLDGLAVNDDVAFELMKEGDSYIISDIHSTGSESTP